MTRSTVGGCRRFPHLSLAHAHGRRCDCAGCLAACASLCVPVQPLAGSARVRAVTARDCVRFEDACATVERRAARADGAAPAYGGETQRFGALALPDHPLFLPPAQR